MTKSELFRKFRQAAVLQVLKNPGNPSKGFPNTLMVSNANGKNQIVATGNWTLSGRFNVSGEGGNHLYIGPQSKITANAEVNMEGWEMDIIEKKKAQRFQFLNALYDCTDGDPHTSVLMWEIGTEIGLDNDQTESIVTYLVNEGLMKHTGMGGDVSICHPGVQEIEAARSQPNKPTQHFPAVQNIITITNSTVSDIQLAQGTHVTQHTQKATASMDAVLTAIDALRKAIELSDIPKEVADDAVADLDIAAAQARKSTPKKADVLGSLKAGAETVKAWAENSPALATAIETITSLF